METEGVLENTAEIKNRMQYQEIYRQGEAVLKKAGIEEASLDARLLLEEVCGTDRTALYVHGDKELSPEQEKR